MENKEKKKKKLGLTTQIFIALALGAVVGIVLNYLVPDSDFKQNVIINGVICCWSGLYQTYANACSSFGSYITCLW